MMQPSIWTQVAAYVGCEDLASALRTLGGLGWEHFELSTEHLAAIEDAPDRDAAVARAVELVGELGVTMPQAHAMLMADVAQADASKRAADVDRLRCELRTCAAMGVRVVVVHPGRGGGYGSRREHRDLLDLNARQFALLAELAGELGVRIALENMADSSRPYGRRQFGAFIEDLLDLIERVGGEALGICLDTSHANMQGLDVAGAVRQAGKRLIATHISDNDGSGDQHRTPGGGTIDWPAVMRALGEIGYAGLLNLEIPGESCPSAEVVRMKVRHARDVAQWLVGQAGGAG